MLSHSACAAPAPRTNRVKRHYSAHQHRIAHASCVYWQIIDATSRFYLQSPSLLFETVTTHTDPSRGPRAHAPHRYTYGERAAHSALCDAAPFTFSTRCEPCCERSGGCSRWMRTSLADLMALQMHKHKQAHSVHVSQRNKCV